MLAVFGLDDLEWFGAVGQEREVAPVGPQLGLGAHESGASDDESLLADDRLGDLRLPVLGVVGERLPVRLGDRGDRVFDPELQAHADRVLPAGLLKTGDQLLVPERRVGPQQLHADRAGTLHAGDQLISEPQHPARASGLPLAQADVEHLAGVRAAGEHRVIPTLLGVPEPDALLLVAKRGSAARIHTRRAGVPGPIRSAGRGRWRAAICGPIGARLFRLARRRRLRHRS